LGALAVIDAAVTKDVLAGDAFEAAE